MIDEFGKVFDFHQLLSLAFQLQFSILESITIKEFSVFKVHFKKYGHIQINNYKFPPYCMHSGLKIRSFSVKNYRKELK